MNSLQERFAPFVQWADNEFGLCQQDGIITTNPDENKDWIEWHIIYYGGNIFEIEVATAPELCEIVYRGKIPSRKFFMSLMKNLEVSPKLNYKLKHYNQKH